MSLKLRFSKPEVVELGTPDEPQRVTYDAMREAARACRELNFNPTAVVVRRMDTRPIANIQSYGVILDIREYVNYQTTECRPIHVHWFDSRYETHERMEDLLLVNPAPAWATTLRILNETMAEERKKAV